MEKINYILGKIKDEAVFVIAFIFAAASCFFVKPDKEYVYYVDLKVILLLFSLMAVVSGFRRINVFTFTANFLISRAKSLRGLIGVLLVTPFFSAMLITNDVALLTFVPLAVQSLVLCEKKDKIIIVVVLQAVFANIGSMLTPMGNPQNLYLYSFYSLRVGEFFKITFPVIALSFVLLLVSLLFIKKEELKVSCSECEEIDRRLLAVYVILGLLSLCAVLSPIKAIVYIAAAIVALLVCIFDKGNFKYIDWFLLLTFICFFVFVGNVGRIDAVRNFVEGGIKGSEFLYSLILSQVISNVPCAVMLAGFCENYAPLILGVNVGGLGTLIASLASLIAFRLYAKYEPKGKVKFLAVFTVINVIFLLILGLFCSIIMCKYFL